MWKKCKHSTWIHNLSYLTEFGQYLTLVVTAHKLMRGFIRTPITRASTEGTAVTC